MDRDKYFALVKDLHVARDSRLGKVGDAYMQANRLYNKIRLDHLIYQKSR